MRDCCRGEGLVSKGEGGTLKLIHFKNLAQLFGNSLIAKIELTREKTPLVTINREKEIMLF